MPCRASSGPQRGQSCSKLNILLGGGTCGYDLAGFRHRHFALTSAAVHFCWLTAHLYEEQISIGVAAVTQACYEPALQSTTEQ